MSRETMKGAPHINVDELYEEASFAEESAEWYYRHGREWEARGRYARAKIQSLQQSKGRYPQVEET